MLAVTSCTSAAEQRAPRGGGPDGERVPAACGPPRFGQIGGRAPAYLKGPLDAFPNDRTMCAGLWLPGAQANFTPQGLAVDGRTAYVSGYDGGGGLGTRFCRVQKVDLRTGRLRAAAARIEGRVGLRPPVRCRHGGGLLLDSHGLWLVETDRLWLLDPNTLDVERAWALIHPVRGSFAVHDGDGRLGLGGFRRGGRARLFWFDTAEVLAGGVLDITESASGDSQPVPAWTQGAVWGDLGPGPEGVWFATAHTYCGVLVGPGGARRGFLPGAEGIDRTSRKTLWALSESATRPYQLAGGRPVVPMLARFDISALGAWARPDCQP